MLKTKMKQLITAVTISSAVALTSVNAFAEDDPMAAGKKLAFDKSKGNCLACHYVKDGNQPGNIGPGLIMMQARFPDKQKLHDKIWGKPETQIKDSMMPPFGQNGILSDKEIDLITDYIYSL